MLYFLMLLNVMKMKVSIRTWVKPNSTSKAGSEVRISLPFIPRTGHLERGDHKLIHKNSHISTGRVKSIPISPS